MAEEHGSRVQSWFGWLRQAFERDPPPADPRVAGLVALFSPDNDRGRPAFTMTEVQRAFAKEGVPESEWAAALDAINRTGEVGMPDGSILKLQRVGAGVARERVYNQAAAAAFVASQRASSAPLGTALFDSSTGLPDERPRAIFADGSKAWLGFAEAGFFECDAASGRCTRVEPSLPGVTAIAAVGDALWVASPGRIGHWSRTENEWRWYELADLKVTALLYADDCVWFGTEDSLGRIDSATGEFQLIDSPLSPTSSLCVVENAVWCGTWDYDGRPAAFVLQRQAWETLPGDAPLCVLEAPLGAIDSAHVWVGTLSGILVFHAQTFKCLGRLCEALGPVYCMLPLAEYTLLGTASGLWAIDVLQSGAQGHVLPPVRVKWPGRLVSAISGTDCAWCIVGESVEICSLDDIGIAQGQCA